MRTFEVQRREFVKLSMYLIEDSHLAYRCEYDYEHAALYNDVNRQICHICDDCVDSSNEDEIQKLRDLVGELG
jgi:hypothetical protein